MREACFIQMRIVQKQTLLQLWLPKERLVETPKGDLAERGLKSESNFPLWCFLCSVPVYNTVYSVALLQELKPCQECSGYLEKPSLKCDDLLPRCQQASKLVTHKAGAGADPGFGVDVLWKDPKFGCLYYAILWLYYAISARSTSAILCYFMPIRCWMQLTSVNIN